MIAPSKAIDARNPYRPPATPDSQYPDRQYYGEMLDAIPFGMLYRMLAKELPKPIAFGITAYFRGLKWIGRAPLPASGFGSIGSSQLLSRNAMPPRPMSRWAKWLEELADLGFEEVAYCVPDLIGAKEGAAALLIDRGRTTLTCLEWFRMPGGDGIAEQTLLEFNSLLSRPKLDNETGHRITEVMTAMCPEESMGLEDAFRPEFIDTEFRLNTKPIQKVYQTHVDRLAGRNPNAIARDIAVSEYEKLSQGRMDWAINRGLVRRLTDRDVEKIRQKRLES